MSETSTSLLDAARRDPHGEAWGRLLDVYAPLIRGWIRRTAVRCATTVLTAARS